MSMSVPDPKAKRYDRQLRIWGTHGQQRLEECRILLLNCGPTGSETLKNLVLGGIASFTIVDGTKVSSRDLGNNFLISSSSLGEPRAKVVTELLQELNDSVAGSYVEESPEVLIANNPQFFQGFGLVIATQMRDQDACRLDQICRACNTQLLLVRSYGLVGYLRPSVPEHRIIESKPDTQVDDLRIHDPWPELRQFATGVDLSKLDDITFQHMPYAVLLIQAADAWKAQHGKPPSNSKERSAFKELIASMRRTVDGVPIMESINFEEAAKAAFHAWTPCTIPSEVRALFDDECAHVHNLHAHSDEFWIMVAALRAYVEAEGQGNLPLEGSVPDMHATTELYLRLSGLYRDKAERDVTAVEGHLRGLLAGLGLPRNAISRDTARAYCKNARNLRLVRCRPLPSSDTEPSGSSGGAADSIHQQLGVANGNAGTGSSSSGSAASPALLKALSANDSAASATDAMFLVLLRAADRFHAQHGRYPGQYDHMVEDDVPLLKQAAVQVLVECGVGGSSNPRRSPESVTLNDDLLVEMCRFGAGELHVIGAFMGGVAAQEAIKLVTRQFVPVAGTLLYNAISCTTTVLDI